MCYIYFFIKIDIRGKILFITKRNFLFLMCT